MWELTCVSILGVVALALVSGRATTSPAALSVMESDRPSRLVRHRFGLGVAAILLAWGAAFAEAIPLLAQREIAHSQVAAGRGDLQEALDAAGTARDIQPWAATPYLQLALVSEQVGTLPLARKWINMAIARDRRDWRLWLTSARIETKLRRVDAANASLRRAVALNPRSPLFKGLFRATGEP
jgi:tetratricopeptide (TPR) repeat protein